MNQTQGPSATDDEQAPGPPSRPPAEPGVDRAAPPPLRAAAPQPTDRKIAGVAGGLGRHLNIDPTVLRVLFVVLCFFGGAGFVLYGAAWLLVPEDGRDQGDVDEPATRNGVLIAAGVLAALLLVGDSWRGIGFPWPVFLVGIGVLVYLAVRDKDGAGAARPRRAQAPSAARSTPSPSADGSADPGRRRVRRAAARSAVAQPAAPYQPPVPPPRRRTGPEAVRLHPRPGGGRARRARPVRRGRRRRARLGLPRPRAGRDRPDARGRRVRRPGRRADLPRPASRPPPSR